MFKYASATLYDPRIAQQGEHRRRTAHRVEFDYTPREGYLYVRSRMISSRCNDNFDEFTPEEIRGDGRTTGYVTFVGKPVFVNHHNDDHRRARGVILDAKLHEDRNPDGSPDTWVEGLMEVDAVRFPKLAKAILAGEIDRTSMGVDVERSQCSKCANVATTPLEYCRHIPAMKGSRIRMVTASGQPTEHLVRERCFGLRFFENSLLVEEPADPTAYFLDKPVQGPQMSRTAARQTPEENSMHIQAGVRRCGLCFSASTLTMGNLIECGTCGHLGPIPRGSGMDDVTAMRHTAAPMHPSKRKFFQENPVHSDHIVDAYNSANKDEIDQGHRWYADAHLTAKAMAGLHTASGGREHPHGNVHMAAGLIANYSPQQGWAGNMHNAARVIHEQRGRGGEGEGIFATTKQKNAANALLNGAHYHDVASPDAHKVRDFQHLIEHGDDADPHHPRVVIDRHALGIAAGRRMSDDDYGRFPKDDRRCYDHVAGAYHEAAQRLSEQHGIHIKAHQVQAVTWLAQQRKNAQAEKENPDASGGEALNKGRDTSRANAEQGWKNFRDKHLPDLPAEPGTGYDQVGGKQSHGPQKAARRRQGSRDFR